MAARLGMAHQELQEWRSNNKDNCSACATAPFDHGLLEQWLDKVKEKQPNFPKEFIIQSNDREERNLLQAMKKWHQRRVRILHLSARTRMSGERRLPCMHQLQGYCERALGVR